MACYFLSQHLFHLLPDYFFRLIIWLCYFLNANGKCLNIEMSYQHKTSHHKDQSQDCLITIMGIPILARWIFFQILNGPQLLRIPTAQFKAITIPVPELPHYQWNTLSQNVWLLWDKRNFVLTCWGQDQMAVILQTTIQSNFPVWKLLLNYFVFIEISLKCVPLGPAIEISLKCVPVGPTNSWPALIQIMVSPWTSDWLVIILTSAGHIRMVLSNEKCFICNNGCDNV